MAGSERWEPISTRAYRHCVKYTIYLVTLVVYPGGVARCTPHVFVLDVSRPKVRSSSVIATKIVTRTPGSSKQLQLYIYDASNGSLAAGSMRKQVAGGESAASGRPAVHGRTTIISDIHRPHRAPIAGSADWPRGDATPRLWFLLLRGTIVNRTYLVWYTQKYTWYIFIYFYYYRGP